MLFTPTDLRILARLNEGLTQAEIGTQLHLEQASISRLLHAAERRSGLQLFVRMAGGCGSRAPAANLQKPANAPCGSCADSTVLPRRCKPDGQDA